jgi:vancomycin resistance protein YoaR
MAQETENNAAPASDEKSAVLPLGRFLAGRRLRVLAAVVPLGVVALFTIPALLDGRLSSQGRARAGTFVLGEPAVEKDRARLTSEIGRAARELERRKLTVIVSGKRFELDPVLVGFKIDDAKSADAVLAVGQHEGIFGRLRGYYARKLSPVTVSLQASLDPAALGRTFDAWEAAALPDRPFSGGIEISVPSVRALPPRAGRAVDARAGEAALLAALVDRAPRHVSLPLVSVPAPLPADAADGPASEARALLANAVTLRSTEPAATVTLSASQLGPTLRTEVDGRKLRLAFDPSGLGGLLERTRRELEREPVNAKFLVEPSGTIGIEPSRPGLRVDMPKVPAALLLAAHSPSREAELPLFHGPAPSLDAERAASLGIKGLVSSFTTRHPCCEKRVDNIHRIADILDGAVVEPGQTVSVNALVGPRTLKNGFVPAPTIEEGEIVDSIGGGVSQFATTFFNALFHAGYEIIERQPHTFWFPRYPMGHEATLSWPKPDIIFKNDTQAGLLIKTAYTGTSITVRLYGDNGGRKVRATVSGRQNVVDAPLEILPNPKLPPDEEKVKEPGSVGWSVIVSRELTFPDGTKKDERRKVTYRARPRRIEIHPCRIPKGEKGYTGERCPEPEDVEEAEPVAESPTG